MANEKIKPKTRGEEMKFIITTITLTILCVVIEAKTWTFRTGNTIEADFIKIKKNIVYLRRIDNGKIIKVEKSKLSKNDIASLPNVHKSSNTTIDLKKFSKTCEDQIVRLNNTTYISNSDKIIAQKLTSIYQEWLNIYKK
jgi:hypothetical protein